MKHHWVHGMKECSDGTKVPIMYCKNGRCRKIWWPDRKEPRSRCNGVPVR